MSVLMTLRVAGNVKAIEATDQAVFDTVIARAKQHGVLRHKFFATESEILVIDEWPDMESFQAFFDSSPEIPEMMAAAGVTSQPQIDFWRAADVDDVVGWD